MTGTLTIAGAFASALVRLSWAFAASVRRTFLAHLPLYACAVVFFAATFWLFSFYDLRLPLGGGLFFLGFAGNCVALWLAVSAAFDLWQFWRSASTGSVFLAVGRRMRDRFFTGDRPGNGFHALATLAPMMIVFACMKMEIPAIHPFAWDATFARWDRVLGAGRMPWEILQPVLGFAPVTIGLNFVYDAWFAIMFAVLMWEGFLPLNCTRRLQYLLAFAFVWFFGGSVLAIVFSSAGPCFYHYLHHNSPYAAQMAYLHGIGSKWVWSLWVQDALWQSYKTGMGEISGISAMPSMHVAIAALLAILGLRTNRKLGIALSIYTGLILIGSVHLAWHYAVDSIAGVGIAALCWLVAGAVARGWFAFVERGADPDWKQAEATPSV
jgi:hypothetical protein